MFKNKSERALRRRLDPRGLLPHVQLATGKGEGLSHVSVFSIEHGFRSVGSLMLTRRFTDGGRPIMQIDSLQLDAFSGAMEFRRSASISALAISSEEGRALVSDESGSRSDEVAIWREWAEADVAEITSDFVERSVLLRGAPVFDGQAIARPLSHR